MEKIAIYPGSFDPWTNGHQSIYDQAIEIFDKVIVVIAHHPHKERFITVDKMLYTLRDMGLTAYCTDELVGDYCNQHDIKWMIRGLRGTSDYLYEESLAKVNTEINPELKTIFFRANDKAISSTMIREFYKRGKSVVNYVPIKVNTLMKTLK